MPARARRGDLEAALRSLARALDATGAPWMVIGGIAGIARGIRRLTTDIAATVRGDAMTIAALMDRLARHGIEPRIDDAASFAEANLVLLARDAATGVDLDVSLAWSGFELDALARRSDARFGRVSAPMCMPADLLVFKAIAGRAKDAEDAQALLALWPEIDVEEAGRRVAELAELADEPEIAKTFEEWLEAARAARAATKTAKGRAGRSTPPKGRRRG